MTGGLIIKISDKVVTARGRASERRGRKKGGCLVVGECAREKEHAKTLALDDLPGG